MNPPRTPFELPTGPDRWWFLGSVAAALALAVLCWRIIPGPWGGITFAAALTTLTLTAAWLLLSTPARVVAARAAFAVVFIGLAGAAFAAFLLSVRP